MTAPENPQDSAGKWAYKMGVYAHFQIQQKNIYYITTIATITTITTVVEVVVVPLFCSVVISAENASQHKPSTSPATVR